MIAIADAGEIKARITIEYDGSGVAKAKEDLASLADISGGFEQAAQDIGGNLSGLSDQFTEGVVASEGFSKTVEALQKPLGSGGLAITQLSDALGKNQDAIAGTGSAFEALQEPLGATVTMLQAAPEPIAQIAQNAESLSKPLASVTDNFATFGDTLTQSVPLLPQFADSLHEVSAAFDPKEFGLDAFQENMSVFQDALVNPEPFSMIKQHLNETGQTWDDFSSSIGDDNAAYLEELAKNSEVTHKVFGGIQEDLTGTGKVADTLDWETIGPPTDWTKGVEEAAVQTENLTSAAQNASNLLPTYGWSPASVNTGVMHGPLTAEQAAAQDAAFSAASEGGLGLGDLFMPMMAVQMVGMAFSSAIQGIQQFMTNVYQMATLMEGPAAHSAGTFTGTVDAVGQSVERASMQFSEGFGQSLIPLLDVVNQQVSGSNGTNLGSVMGNIVNAGSAAILDQFFPGASILLGDAEAQAAISAPPVPLSPAQRYTMTQLSQMPQTVDMSAAQMGIQADQALAESMSPDYLAAVRKNNEAQQILQQAQLNYNATHPALSRQQLLAQYQFEQYAAGQGFTPDQIAGMEAGNYGVDQVPVQQGPADISDIFGAAQGGGLFGPSSGVSSFLSNMYRGIFNGLGWLGQNWDAFGLGVFSGPTGDTAAPGCFPAGTRVKMADGSERGIETLQIGEQVSAHDGMKQVTATITALLRPPRKQVYELIFDDGSRLRLTNAHPVATSGGWKSLSPAASMREIPGLLVSRLRVGDTIFTVTGTCTLVDWHPGEVMQVYNIEVGGPHTFYAESVLVHNNPKFQSANAQTGIGAQIADMVSSIQLPKIDLSGMTSSLAGMFSGIQLPHLDLSGFTSGLGSLFSGIQLPHIDLSGFTSGLASAFSSIQMPHIDLSSIMNIGAEISNSVSGMFSSIHLPSIPDIAGDINSAVGGFFSGIHLPSLPDIAGSINSAIGGFFNGLHLPSLPDIAGDINSAIGGFFSGLHLPSLPDVAGEINNAIGGFFSGIHLPSLPDIAGSINSMLSSMVSNIHIPAIPGFASGVENFEGGLAWIGEGQEAEIVTRPTLMNLSPGTNVTPLSQFVSGGMPISFPSLVGSASNSGGSLTLYLMVDSSMLASVIIPQIAPVMRAQFGVRR